jgi:hypothetical protein
MRLNSNKILTIIIVIFMTINVNAKTTKKRVRNMVTLKDTIEINTTIDELYDWFMNIDVNFTKWHHNHKKFEKITGGSEVGDIIYFEQLVNGVWYKVKAKIILKEKNKDNFKIIIKSTTGLGTISFLGKTTENSCVFTHIESFGLSTPVIGNAINFLLFRVFFRKHANWKFILQDMKDDDANLKKILESKGTWTIENE